MGRHLQATGAGIVVLQFQKKGGGRDLSSGGGLMRIRLQEIDNCRASVLQGFVLTDAATCRFAAQKKAPRVAALRHSGLYGMLRQRGETGCTNAEFLTRSARLFQSTTNQQAVDGWRASSEGFVGFHGVPTAAP